MTINDLCKIILHPKRTNRMLIAFSNCDIKVTNKISSPFLGLDEVTDNELITNHGWKIKDDGIYIPKGAQLNFFWGPGLKSGTLDCNVNMLNTILDTEDDIFELWEGDPSLTDYKYI